jgi:hypothetical protein
VSPRLEELLREALAPIEPPEVLTARLETTLAEWTELAQGELDSWELSAMEDPRDWVRPAAAAVVAVSAGTALVALRVRGRHKARVNSSANLLELAEQTIADIAEETRRILPDK